MRAVNTLAKAMHLTPYVWVMLVSTLLISTNVVQYKGHVLASLFFVWLPIDARSLGMNGQSSSVLLYDHHGGRELLCLLLYVLVYYTLPSSRDGQCFNYIIMEEHNNRYCLLVVLKY